MHPQTNSRFFGLPRVVRDMIYKEAISGYTICVDEDEKPSNLGIILACRQTYDGTINLYYKTMTFRFENFDSGIYFLGSIPDEYRQLITKVHWDAPFDRVDFHMWIEHLTDHDLMDTKDLRTRPRQILLRGLEANGIKMKKDIFKASICCYTRGLEV